MEVLFGVEANYIIEDVPEFVDFIKGATELFDFQEGIFIFKNKYDAELTKDALMESGLFETSSLLLYIKIGEIGKTFYDFGLESQKGFYLFPESLCAFTIIGGDSEAIQMAEFQFQEHLVFTEKNEQAGRIYFTEHHLKDLMTGISAAYDIQVSFLDLDKQKKKL